MSAALLQKLIEAGTPATLVAEVAMELARAEAANDLIKQRRAKDRERKRLPRNSTESKESAETVSPLSPPLKVSPDPFKITPPISPHPNNCSRMGFLPPEGVSADQWKAFRKQRKKPVNERSYVLLCNKLHALAEAGYPPGEMIDLAIERGWETVFEPKDQRNGQSRHSGLGKTSAALLQFGDWNDDRPM